MSTGTQRPDKQSVALVTICAVLVLANLFGTAKVTNSLVTLARSQTEFVDAVVDRLEAMSQLNKKAADLE